MAGTNKNSVYYWVILISLFLGACKKPKPIEYAIPPELHNGFLTLNEGLFQQNNATLTWYSIDEKKTYPTIFEKINGLGLGDTGNDLQVYGNKIYIVVNNSNILHILDKKTGKLIKQVPLSNNNSGSSPRHIDFGGAYAYICAFDGTIFQLDTSTLTIQQKVIVGTNPEDIELIGNYLFVSNSGGLNYPVMDSTISVFNLNNLHEIKRIVVGKNPGQLIQDAFGNLWVSVNGDASLNEGKLTKIRVQDLTKELDVNLNCSNIAVGNGIFYISSYNYSTLKSSVITFDPQTASVSNTSFIDGAQFETIYGIQYLNAGGQALILINDAKSYIHDGSVSAFDLNGQFLFSYTSGLNPNTSIFLP